MKQVKNKRYGDVGELDFDSKEGTFIVVFYNLNTKSTVKSYYKSIKELSENWEDYEDYEEPKGYWYISADGSVNFFEVEVDDWCLPTTQWDIGNHFDTREEAEKAVEKLKAWKRLKDEYSFKFTGWERDPRYRGDFVITAQDWNTSDDKDLDLLFGGEDE